MMTIAPPVVQPSLGLMALMHGVAEQNQKDIRAPGYRVVFPLRFETVCNSGCKPLQEGLGQVPSGHSPIKAALSFHEAQQINTQIHK